MALFICGNPPYLMQKAAMRFVTSAICLYFGCSAVMGVPPCPTTSVKYASAAKPFGNSVAEKTGKETRARARTPELSHVTRMPPRGDEVWYGVDLRGDQGPSTPPAIVGLAASEETECPH